MRSAEPGVLEGPAPTAPVDDLRPELMLPGAEPVDGLASWPSARRNGGRVRRRGWVVRRALVAADALGILLAFAVAQLVFGETATAGRFDALTELLVFAAFVPAWLVLARVYGLYARDEERADHSSADDTFAVFNMLTVGTFAFYAFSYAFPGLTEIPLPKILLFWVLAFGLVTACRTAARGICRRTAAYRQNTLIVGAGLVGQRVAQKLIAHPEYGVNVVGFVDEHPRERQQGLGDLVVLGSTDHLDEIVRRNGVERVIIAFSQDSHTKTLQIIRDLNELDVQVDVVPRLFEVLGPHATLHAAEGLPLLGLPPARMSRSSLVVKRAMDLVLSVGGLVVFSPLLAAIAVAIRLDSPGPALFRQTRVGRGDREFRMLKFRTMVADADARKDEVAHLNKHAAGDGRMFKVADDPRTTRVGRFLRRTSLDELPQLWNVVRGEMSLVGPRPLIPEEHHHVGGWARRRVDLKPGMTGLWQVLGRDDIPFGEMVGLDYQYVTSWSVGNDLKLMMRTVGVLRRSMG